jgi:hypothetical protein
MELTQAIVGELLTYEPSTGVLRWRKRSRKWFSSDNACNAWNARFAVKSVSSRASYGHLRVSIFHERYLAHRIIFFYIRGRWPVEIDHINRRPADNRWSNLREVPHRVNLHNQSMPKNNRSGRIGVSWYTRKRKWQAKIWVDEGIHLGYFDTFQEAAEARRAAEQHYMFSRTRAAAQHERT